MQLVLMKLDPKQEIGTEVHPKTTQFIRVEEGTAHVQVDQKRYVLKRGKAIVINPGSTHNVTNSSSTEDLHLYTLYSPPEHQPDTREKLKKD